MADAKLPGNDSGEDKNRRPQEVRNGGPVPAKTDARINSAVTNAKRRRQRRKFSAALKKSGLELNGWKNEKNVRQVQGNNKAIKAERPENARIREELHPRPLSPDESRPRVLEKAVFPDTARPAGVERKPTELPQKTESLRATEPLRKTESPKVPEPSKTIEPLVPKNEGTEPVVSEPEVSKEHENLPVGEAENQSAGVTYFSHPFSEGDDGSVNPSATGTDVPKEDVNPAKDQENELQGGNRLAEKESAAEQQVDKQPEQQPEEPLPIVEAIGEVEPMREDVSAEDEISIGKEEPSPPIPVGRLKEVESDKEEIDETETKPEKDEEAMVSVIENKKEEDEQAGKEQLVEKESPGKMLKSWLSLNWPKVTASLKNVFAGAGRQTGGVLSKLNARRVVSCLVVIIVIAGGVYGYGQKWHEKAYSYLSGLVTPKPVEKVEVKVDPVDQRMFGITSVAVFGGNRGSGNDLVPVQINMAVFFGELKEPKVKGETGITALTFYGELKDGADVINQFVVYMQNLQDVQNLYKTDVYAMLDRSTGRDKVLLDYLDKLKQAREKSQVLHDQIVVNMDDFNKSYQTLNPDKTKYEQDFFAAMANLEPEKSDLLLKGFIDITQKQSALKARVSALTKLEGYYASALVKLDTRILAVEQNRDALIQGIKVVDIPGADLNIIIKPTQ
jgi:hypothetical protein